MQGKAEAISGYSSNEPYYFKRANYPYRTFSPRSAGIDFYGDNLFTSEQELRDHPQQVQAFRAASMRGWLYAKEHRDEVIDLIIAKYSRKHTRDYLRFESDQMIPLLQPDLIEIGYMNPNRWRHIADTYAGIGLLPADYPLEGFLYDPDPDPDTTLLYRYGAIALLLIGLSSGISLYIYRINRRLARTLAERREAGEAEKQARGFGEAIIASIPGAFYMLDAAGRFVRWNAYQRDEIVGKSDAEMPEVSAIDTVHPDDRPVVSAALASGQEEALESRVLLRGGPAFRWFLMTGRQVMLGGEPFLVGAGVDITERKRTDVALAAAKAQAEAVNHDLEEANRQLEMMSVTDSLTGIANRRRFDEMLLHEWRRATRSHQPLALAMLDLDWFKDYNDRYGHQAGDTCLRAVAGVLQTQARRSSDLAARYGGDEFVFIAPETEVESMLRLAKAIHDALASLGLPNAGSPRGRVTVSIGVAVQVPAKDAKPEGMLRMADEALYRAKEQGRDQTVLAAEGH
jgi:diguanylate cyclase (GGDEF)-like protein/PAS domain S-box-containing protein